MDQGLQYTVEVDQKKYSLSNAYFEELKFIIENGPIFENTMRPNGARDVLFNNGFVSYVVVGRNQEKVAATKLGGKVYQLLEDERARIMMTSTSINFDLNSLRE